MFGCCVAGRLLQTNLQQIDETHACFELPNAETINHICVFLIGTGASWPTYFTSCSITDQIRPPAGLADSDITVPFPEGYGATVHFFWPGKGFQLLGM